MMKEILIQNIKISNNPSTKLKRKILIIPVNKYGDISGSWGRWDFMQKMIKNKKTNLSFVTVYKYQIFESLGYNISNFYLVWNSTRRWLFTIN